VIIPVYNDPSGLTKTVESLLQQDSDEYEIVIVDNGSTDRITNIARQYSENEIIRFAVEDEIQSSYAARNKGIHIARGGIIAFIDADMWVDSDYIGSVRKSMSSNQRVYMGCDVEVVNGSESVERYNANYAFPIKRFIDNHKFAPTCCLVVRRCLFDMVGTFDSRLTSSGDAEFGNRVASAGFELVFEPQITMYHPARSSMMSLISTSIRLGRGQEQIRRRHPETFGGWSLFDPRIVLPPYPRKFVQYFDNAVQSPWEYLFWYLLTWIRKLARLYGRIKQKSRTSGTH
jgi:glycosyltransferase involved in cell wall biosynthesis